MDKSVFDIMPSMLNGENLDDALKIFPEYDKSIQQKSATERLVALQDIYKIFIPNAMSREIYSKLYLALIRSLQKKQSIIATRQFTENARLIRQQSYESIIGGADCFTIIGPSGIGKSGSVTRAISILMNSSKFEMRNAKIIPCLVVQCPADASIKGLLLEILRKTDEILDSKYYSNALRSHSTIDVLIGSVSQVALTHIGLLVIDEIQNIVQKNGKSMFGTLTQLINNSGVSIVMVGTPECEGFFSSGMVLARRSVGLSYSEIEYGDEYRVFVSILLRYIYTQNNVEICESLYMWLYSHSGGNASITVQLIHDAQEIAILEGTELIDIASLTRAFENRMRFLHEYIKPQSKTYSLPKKSTKVIEESNKLAELPIKISDISISAKRSNKDIISELTSNGIKVIEVRV